jgi:hypothetical protein
MARKIVSPGADAAECEQSDALLRSLIRGRYRHRAGGDVARGL